MATQGKFSRKDIGSHNPIFSQIRTTIETAFYRNNVTMVTSLKEAYKLAKNSPGTIVTDMPVYKPELLGLDDDAKILLLNDGTVFGRTAAARRILGEPGINQAEYATKIREAIYLSRTKKFYHAQVIVGLDKDFSVKANLCIPAPHENIMYSWLLNFQAISEMVAKMYAESKTLENEGDIYIFSDPDWSHPDHPMGLSFVDPKHNCAAILGMRYFGEHKKGTLTIAWGIANRHGYASCHGGQKRYNLPGGKSFVAGVFGLSGSGKSTITHARHNDKYDITVLHDDAFVISTEDSSSVALEPAYFDKTQDYPLTFEDNKFLLTMQNNGATMDADGNIVPVTEDIRNGNGRAVKSILWSPNRINKFDEPVNAIFWLMKDPTIPPVVKLSGAELASVMGATLATKRSTAERLAPGVDPNALVVEPYANPFRTYPLADDYNKFKTLVAERNVDCYILNTGDFMGKKVTPAVTLGVLEAIVEGNANFKPWGPFSDIEIMEIDGYVPNLKDDDYVEQLQKRMEDRVTFIKSRDEAKGGFDKLPDDALEAIEKVVKESKNA
ncbi:phosphoenolpyruvate carboxykinase [Candidatus Epulonipiscium fishelsonii]|uniref:Phosphoenolpyruvate carboxykinase n=1 Tax=Candidatus Epulonipiscium fishelsonii TaxID=77094 RepID=A0ACC8XAU6_9FIRM|nr:phosphoenolpyruvate carboxykinase [Epulopiscium sp. SCG-B05WGA-EpuloA1]ONI39418.1 phosphoenolpyruvate carboxykinase [Epulopiscium sp. SCG-B11WGA-EpuloA1]